MKQLMTYCIAALIITVSEAAHGAIMDPVKTKIDSEKTTQPTITIPDDPPKSDMSHFPRLEITIAALSTHSFCYLFDKDTLAREVVSDWISNIDEDSSLNANLANLLRRRVKALALELFSNHDKMKFWELTETRLLGNHPAPLKGKLDDLLADGFQFPLFITTLDGPIRQDKIALLVTLVSKHMSQGVGGFGNLTWHQLFYTPATKDLFSVDKINNVVSKVQNGVQMQRHILPSPVPDIWRSTITETAEKLLLASNQCCCNWAAHGAGQFRTCADKPGPYCNMCGGSYCCLFNSIFCSGELDHGH